MCSTGHLKPGLSGYFMTVPKVSTIVLNWRSKDTIEDCLDSLLDQSHAPHEILLIDNGSSDGSLEILRRKYHGRIRILENANNLGFAGGVNQGIRASESEYVALLNADAVAAPDWIAELVKGLQADERAGMATSKIYFAGEEKVLDNTGNNIYRDACAKPRGRLEKDAGQYDARQNVGYASGCAVLYRRAMLDEVGLFDERMFAYGEDMDLALRGRLAGYGCVFVPTAVVYHGLSGSLGPLSALKLYYVERNRLWTVLKCFPWPYLCAAPFYTLWRYAHYLAALWSRRGPATQMAEKVSGAAMILAVLKAYGSTLFSLGYLLRKRKEVFNGVKIPVEEFGRIFKDNPVTARDLAFGEMFQPGQEEAWCSGGCDGTVSIIILNFNGKMWLAGCLDSLRGLDFPKEKLEIILGDNASTDDSVKFVKEHYPKVKIVAFDRNYGFCKPNNICAKTAAGEFLVFLNNDTFVTRDWLRNLVAAAQADPQVVSCASKIFFADPPGGKVLNAAGGVFLCSGSGAYDGWMTEDRGQFDVPRETGFGCAAGVLVRRDFFLETGGFDEYFFYSSEEMDLGYRAWMLGKRVLYVPSAVMDHHMGKTGFRGKGVTPAIEFLICRNHLYFLLKNFQLPPLIKGLFLYEIRVLLKIVYAAVRGQFRILGAILGGQLTILKDLPWILKARKDTQRMRKVSDKALTERGLLLGIRATVRRNQKLLKALGKYGNGSLYDDRDKTRIGRDSQGDLVFLRDEIR